MAITNEQQTQIFKIVAGLFNGGISSKNVSTLATMLDNGSSMLDLANLMAVDSSFTDQIMGGKITVQSQVNVLMKNFGVVADSDPTSPGSLSEIFFTNSINNGVGFGAIINMAVEFLSAADLAPEFSSVAALLNNKALVSEIYTGRNLPNDFATNVAVLADVTETSPATREEAIAFVDIFTANKISLTSGDDNLVGTSGIDVYSAVYDPTGNATTISNADILDGTDGTDLLNIRIASTAAAAAVVNTIAPSSFNIENFFLTNQSGTGNFFTLDFINIEDEVQVLDKGSVTGANTVALNVDPTTTVGMADTLGSFFVDFSGDGDRSGSSDAFTLQLTGAGTAAQQAFFSTFTATQAIDITFEIANISSTATLSNVGLSTSAKTVNVSGDAALILEDHNSFFGLGTVDASQMTAGGLNIDASGSTETNFNFTGSSADDRIVLSKNTIETAGSLDGGAGKDTLATQNFLTLTAAALNKATGFEVIEGVDGAESFILGSATSINEFLFTGTTGSNNGFNITDIESNDRIAYSTDITSGGSSALRLAGKNAGNSATIELRAIDETNGETIITTDTSNTDDTFGIQLNSNIASFTLDSTGTSTNANVIETNQNNGFFGYAFNNPTTALFNITGSHDLAVMAKAGVDISQGNSLLGFFSAVNVDASTFTGVLRIAGSLFDDVIKGGNNADIIYGMGGFDTLTGNAGADQFRMLEFFTRTDTITDFVKGTDKVGLNLFDFVNTTATQAGATLSPTDYVENRSAITNIGINERGKVVELQASLSGLQIETDTGAAVEAYLLVHNTTSGKAELWYDDDWSTAGGSRDHIVTYDNIVDLAGVQDFSNTDFVEYIF